MNDDEFECRYQEVRYQEAGPEWFAQLYKIDVDHAAIIKERQGGLLGRQPEWLKKILDVAKVGGHLTPMRDGPPDRLLWFTMDHNYNLLEFTFP